MKANLGSLLVGLCGVCLISLPAFSQAALLSRADGLMFYDDVLDITWVQDANLAKTSGYSATGRLGWNQASIWASELTYGGYSDWRLPTMLSYGAYQDPRLEAAVAASAGHVEFNSGRPQSELSYMFFVNGTSLFSNVQENELYWTNVEYNVITGDPRYDFFGAWAVLAGGRAGGYSKTLNSPFAWAVRDGDVHSVQEPMSTWLVGTAVGLALFARRVRRIKTSRSQRRVDA